MRENSRYDICRSAASVKADRYARNEDKTLRRHGAFFFFYQLRVTAGRDIVIGDKSNRTEFNWIFVAARDSRRKLTHRNRRSTRSFPTCRQTLRGLRTHTCPSRSICRNFDPRPIWVSKHNGFTRGRDTLRNWSVPRAAERRTCPGANASRNSLVYYDWPETLTPAVLSARK